MQTLALDNLAARIGRVDRQAPMGRVLRVDGTLVHVSGLGHAVSVGDRLRLAASDGPREGSVLRIDAESVAMMPESGCDGIRRGDRVLRLGRVCLSPSASWIGRILDPFGRPLDGGPVPAAGPPRPFHADPPPAAARRGFGPRLATGLAVFDTILPLVSGQRIGVFAGSGVGKSRLLARLAQRLESDVVVLALIGERGRELRDFVEDVLGPEGMARSVVITATSDRSALERRRCAYAAMTVAEHFRDAGVRVLLLADSITRFADAHREVAFAAGELPTLRGHPASTAQKVMSLCERAGPGGPGQGDITAVFTVLVAGSDMEEPIADILRGTLDGHVVLSREIAERGRFPAVDVLRSVSRALPGAASAAESAAILDARRLIGAHAGAETMIRAGLYKEGGDPLLDRAVRAWDDLDQFVGSDGGARVSDSFDRLNLILRRSQSQRSSVQQG
ncbi:flagellum-specific ATP synthase [Roseivivax lentus]|uniref:Flagellum-specific ATP synthase n=1 Tax=Roseivivax lentus TaxID=633194 RepID=A0A1N7JL22_9RHOB|nr:FliI/YscN family ATPase [Roseivivax lentus]SIS50010.1 flagellum-specific ATP synthase [Roseivivax lentus]